MYTLRIKLAPFECFPIIAKGNLRFTTNKFKIFKNLLKVEMEEKFLPCCSLSLKYVVTSRYMPKVRVLLMCLSAFYTVQYKISSQRSNLLNNDQAAFHHDLLLLLAWLKVLITTSVCFLLILAT
jgi:hypothetical protein